MKNSVYHDFVRVESRKVRKLGYGSLMVKVEKSQRDEGIKTYYWDMMRELRN